MQIKKNKKVKNFRPPKKLSIELYPTELLPVVHLINSLQCSVYPLTEQRFTVD